MFKRHIKHFNFNVTCLPEVFAWTLDFGRPELKLEVIN